ncbi:unnamed protein product, partial [Effrenium voratum]
AREVPDRGAAQYREVSLPTGASWGAGAAQRWLYGHAAEALRGGHGPGASVQPHASHDHPGPAGCRGQHPCSRLREGGEAGGSEKLEGCGGGVPGELALCSPAAGGVAQLPWHSHGGPGPPALSVHPTQTVGVRSLRTVG